MVDEDQAGRDDGDQDDHTKPQKAPEKELGGPDAEKQPPEVITNALNEIHNIWTRPLRKPRSILKEMS